MADELEFDLEDEPINNERSEKRIKTLAEKVRTEAEAKEKALQEKADADLRTQAAEKERDFYQSFSDSTAKYPNASEYKDDIKEKVLSGYSVEDATVSVLAKEGKLTAPVAPRETIAGGSAPNAISSDGPKSLNEMSREDKRAELQRIESEGGDLSRILRSSS